MSRPKVSPFFSYTQDITEVTAAIRTQYPCLEPSEVKQVVITVLTALRRVRGSVYIVPSLPEKTYEELVLAVQEMELI